LPLLALVFAEVLDDERFNVGDAEQALACSVDGEAAKVTGDPAAVELFGDGGGGAGTAEAIENEGTLVGRCFDNSIKECLRLLRVVIEPLYRLGVYW